MTIEADMSMTQMAFEGNNARFAHDDKLWIKFHIVAMLNDEKTAQEGRPMYDDVEQIIIMQPGNKDSIVDRPLTDEDRRRFAQHYQRWKTDEKEVIEGTPLEQWPRITRSQVEELKHFNCRTVEQLAEMSDTNAQKFMGLNMMRKEARAWLQKAKKGAEASKLVAELEKRDNQIAALQQAVVDLQDKLAKENKGA